MVIDIKSFLVECRTVEVPTESSSKVGTTVEISFSDKTYHVIEHLGSYKVVALNIITGDVETLDLNHCVLNYPFELIPICCDEAH